MKIKKGLDANEYLQQVIWDNRHRLFAVLSDDGRLAGIHNFVDDILKIRTRLRDRVLAYWFLTLSVHSILPILLH